MRPLLPIPREMTARASRIPQIGDPAPDFTLGSTAGGTVTLSAMRGISNVLLAFFPLAFTRVCTSEMCAFSEDFEVFAGQGVDVVPISVDSVPTLKEFKQKYTMHVHMLSDFKREASRAYGVLREDTFFSNRAYFLIDKAGMVRWAHVEDAQGQRRENTEILAAIAAVVT